MSTKKDKFSLKDRLYMDLAFDLARSREGLTGINPSVGCVIVKNDKIISIGQTSFNGRPHAESNAIRNTSEKDWYRKWPAKKRTRKKRRFNLANIG